MRRVDSTMLLSRGGARCACGSKSAMIQMGGVQYRRRQKTVRRIPRLALPPLSIFLAILGLGGSCAARGPWQWQFENDNTREEFRSFEQFLSSHPWIAEKLRKDPTLANSGDFLSDNKELGSFLNAHPFVQADLKQNPRAFMLREQEFERWEREQVAASSDPRDASVAEFDQFLSNHPWIAKKLKEKPSLANDKDFLSDNSELPHFLNARPYVQSALREDPVRFMQRLRDFEIYGSYYNNEAMRGQLAEFDVFLANHPWISKKLREKPSLANNQDFLHDNPELRDYLSAHPVLQQEFRSNPRGVMNRAYPRGY